MRIFVTVCLFLTSLSSFGETVVCKLKFGEESVSASVSLDSEKYGTPDGNIDGVSFSMWPKCSGAGVCSIGVIFDSLDVEDEIDDFYFEVDRSGGETMYQLKGDTGKLLKFVCIYHD